MAWTYNPADYQGGYNAYPDLTQSKIFFRADDYKTKTGTIVAGQVLKARTFLESLPSGKLQAHSGVVEKDLITFPVAGITTGKTFIVAGLTFTAGTGTTSQAELAAAFANLTDGTTAAQANTLNASALSAVIGSFTAGTLTGYRTKASATAGSVLFLSSSPNTAMSAITATGTGATTGGDSPTATFTVTVVNTGTSEPKPIAGILLMDVNALGGDVSTPVFTDASFWVDALVWSNSPGDTITSYDFSTVSCTEYDTGIGNALIDIKQKFVEWSEFAPLGYLTPGEQY